MQSLKRKLRSKKRLNSASSSTLGSISDLDERVIMLCEEIPPESSSYLGRSSHSLGARSSRGSQSGERDLGSEPRIMHLSRDGHAHSHAHRGTGAPRELYMQRAVGVYEQNLLHTQCPLCSF